MATWPLFSSSFGHVLIPLLYNCNIYYNYSDWLRQWAVQLLGLLPTLLRSDLYLMAVASSNRIYTPYTTRRRAGELLVSVAAVHTPLSYGESSIRQETYVFLEIWSRSAPFKLEQLKRCRVDFNLPVILKTKKFLKIADPIKSLASLKSLKNPYDSPANFDTARQRPWYQVTHKDGLGNLFHLSFASHVHGC